MDGDKWNRVSGDGAVASITQSHCVLGGYKLMTCIDIKIDIEIFFKQALFQSIAISCVK